MKKDVTKKTYCWTTGILLIISMIQGPLVLGQLIHPGLSHKKSDLERMKYMVEGEIDPWYSSYKEMCSLPTAQYDYVVQGSTDLTEIHRDSPYTNLRIFENDSRAAYYNILRYNIEGDERFAQKAVECLNAWTGLTQVQRGGTEALTSNLVYVMLEAAELIKSTYPGWTSDEIKAFSDMLVYPGYSDTEVPSDLTNATWYWRSYKFDKIRAGNQELCAIRTCMAIGVFLDNQKIFDRAYRYYLGMDGRTDDLPFPMGPHERVGISDSNQYRIAYNVVEYATDPNYHGNGMLTNYVWENGQCQESSRDQAHTSFGLGIMCSLGEITWNQGYDTYGFADSRLLLGLEYTTKYNVSYEHTYPDQTEPWEPTVESGEFIIRDDATLRNKSLSICPFIDTQTDRLTRGFFAGEYTWEQPVSHYLGRGLKHPDEALWTTRARDKSIEINGRYEFGPTGGAYLGFGGLTYRRVDNCLGDPISGFTENHLPNYSMHVIPGNIEVENYDHDPVNGEGRIYHDSDAENTGGEYRLDQGVDLETCSEGGYQLTSLEDGEWLTYTVHIPANSLYNISVRYASTSADGKIKFSFGSEEVTDEVVIPFGGENSTGLDDWKDLMVSNDVFLKQGVQPMKISISGASNAFVLNNISIELGSDHECEGGLSSVNASSRFIPGVNYNHYEGNWDNLPDFEALNPTTTGITESLNLIDGISGDGYGLVFESYLDLPISGIYTFYTNSSDGSRLLVDGVEVVNNDGVHEGLEVSGDICLDDGFHLIRVEYFNKTDEELLSVMYSGPTVSKQAISGMLAIGACENQPIDEVPDNLEAGVRFEYYEGEWTTLPDFNSLEPIDVGNIPEINLNTNGDYFAYVFQGYLQIEVDGDYTFFLRSDDGSKLYINDNAVLDNDGVHNAQEEIRNSMCLAPGYHKLRIEYFEATGGNSLSLMYEGPDIEKQTVSKLFTEPSSEKMYQTITFPAFPVVLVSDEDFVPGATTNSDLPLSYSSSNPEVATIIDGKIRVVSNGVTEITASQDGNWMYHPADAVSQTLYVFKEAGCALPWTKETVIIKDQTLSYSSELIDISCVSSASISMKLLGTSGLLSEDYLNVYYSIDAGDPQIIAEITGPFTSQEYVVSNVEGESIRLFFECLSSTMSGTYRLSEIVVGENIEDIDIPLSTNLPDNEVKVYPNPAREYLALEIGNLEINAVKIFSIHGKVLFETSVSQEINTLNINITNFPPGVYFMRLLGGDKSQTIGWKKQ